MISESKLRYLNSRERQALSEFVGLVKEQFNGLISSAVLFGSKARGESTPDSDLDVLVVVESDDWRVHKQIRYLAADVCLKYDVDLSPRVWSAAHRREMEELQSLLYQNISREGLELLDLAGSSAINRQDETVLKRTILELGDSH